MSRHFNGHYHGDYHELDEHHKHHHDRHEHRKPVIDAEEIRHKIQDYIDTNIPLGIEYLKDEDLERCLKHAIEDFNETPPIFRFRQFDEHTFPYKHLALLGAVAYAFDLTKKKELRGEMSYSDGGVDSTIYHKTAAFQGLHSEAQQEYEMKKTRVKRQMNIEFCYGGMS